MFFVVVIVCLLLFIDMCRGDIDKAKLVWKKLETTLSDYEGDHMTNHMTNHMTDHMTDHMILFINHVTFQQIM